MKSSLSHIRWLRVLGVSISVIALSFVVLMIITAGYACVLAYEARGAPDQSAIGRFAAQISPRLFPWLECFFALILSFSSGRKIEEGSAIQGILVGIFAGVLAISVAILFRGHISPSSLLFSIGVAVAGCIGGLLGENWSAKK